MNKQELEKKRDAIEGEFNKLQDNVRQLQENMIRLQGQHQLLVEQIIELDKPKPSPEANKIDPGVDK